MKRKLSLFGFFMVLATMVYADADLRVLPHSWNLNAKGKGRVKAEIRNVNASDVNLSSITMNGVAPVKTKITPRKVIAFFSKKEVLETLGAVESGQTYPVNVSFTTGNGPESFLTDTIKVVGKKKGTNKGSKPPAGSGQSGH